MTIRDRIRLWLGIEELARIADISRSFVWRDRERDATQAALEQLKQEAQNARSEDRDTLRLSLEQLRREITEQAESVRQRVGAHVQEHLAQMQSSPNRHVACPVCGKSYNLNTLGVMHNTRSLTICCESCKNHFEVRPGLFWEKVEVERR